MLPLELICPVCGAAQDAEEAQAPAEEIVPEEAVQEEAGQEELTMEAFDKLMGELTAFHKILSTSK